MTEDSANQASIGRDVFVSYASQDVATADAVVENLERQGIKCWIAPRDVTPGSQYADEIVGAINDAKILVLVLSEHAVASPHVGKEIERASSKRRRIIGLRTDAAPLTRSFEYFLSESQWIDVAALGMPGALTKLTQAVEQGLAPSSWVSPGLGADARNPADRKRKLKFLTIQRVFAAAVFLVVAAIIVDVVIRYWPSKQGDVQSPAVAAISDKSIAVLPFADMSQKKDQEYFADGIAEQVLEHLARIPGLKVIGRTSSFQFRGSTLDVPSIGARIGVAHLLEGSVQRSGDTVRVTAQLISTKDGSHEWSDTYESKFDDVLKVQDAIASGLARALEIAVGDVQIPVSHRINAAAYDLFLKGMHAFDPFTEEGCQEAIGLFTQSLQLDPKFAPAEVGIAWAYDDIGQNGWLPTELAYGRARASAMRALELDPTLGAAHTVLADVRLVYDWDWAAAQREIDAAFVSGGRTSAGLAVAARIAAATDPASEKAAILLHEAIALDPLNAEAQIVLGYWVYARTGRFSEGARWIRRGLEISPHWGTGHYFLAIDLLMDGHIDEAIESAKAEKPDDGQFLALAAIYHAQHRFADSDAFLAKAIATNGDSWASAIAMLYAWRGEADKAMQWLERAYTQHDEQLYMIKGEPQLRNLEKDERYRDFLRKMNLPEKPT
jgi:adenylate cyclase